MSEYIHKEEVLRLLNRNSITKSITFADGVTIYDTILNMPTADVQEVKHGNWIYNLTYYESDECNCSLCGQLMTTAKGVRMNYCPNCGAKMDGGNNG